MYLCKLNYATPGGSGQNTKCTLNHILWGLFYMQRPLVWYIASYIHQPPALLPCFFLNTGLLCAKVVIQVRFWAQRVQEDFVEQMAIFLD